MKREIERMTSGARETGKATVRDSASAAGEWQNTENKPRPKRQTQTRFSPEIQPTPLSQ